MCDSTAIWRAMGGGHFVKEAENLFRRYGDQWEDGRVGKNLYMCVCVCVRGGGGGGKEVKFRGDQVLHIKDGV